MEITINKTLQTLNFQPAHIDEVVGNKSSTVGRSIFVQTTTSIPNNASINLLHEKPQCNNALSRQHNKCASCNQNCSDGSTHLNNITDVVPDLKLETKPNMATFIAK